ncbi:hypothetical protein Tco_0480950 [Tanacetum coccineum]
MDEAHTSRIQYIRSDKDYYDLRDLYVARYEEEHSDTLADVLHALKIESEHQKPTILLQVNQKFPEWKLGKVSNDFITTSLKAAVVMITIWSFVIDKTKVDFISNLFGGTQNREAQRSYVNRCSEHGVPGQSFTYRYGRFTSHLRQALQEHWVQGLDMSNTYPPSDRRQSERTNRRWRICIEPCVMDFGCRLGYSIFPLIEFSKKCNHTSINGTIRGSGTGGNEDPP